MNYISLKGGENQVTGMEQDIVHGMNLRSNSQMEPPDNNMPDQLEEDRAGDGDHMNEDGNLMSQVPSAALGKFFCAFFNLKNHYCPDVFAIFEPRISRVNADKLIRKSGFDYSFRVEATGFSRVQDGVEVFVTFVYASPNPTTRHSLWPELRQLATRINVPWLIGGDFNCILRQAERRGGAISRNNISADFSDWLFDCELHEVRTDGLLFTWERGGLTEARLLYSKFGLDDQIPAGTRPTPSSH
ncbi:AGC (cAMP-dependent [Striga asiatica]|uniref:AGC (cAMP-dependent) n=1 Tax=Striga asiatica TaxID=4170 RepID=A0A5A7P4D5_STRAF|nr:AGC (cAMP-dependent [Striga asiatica]